MIRTKVIDAKQSDDPKFAKWKARFRSGALAFEEGKLDEANHVFFLALHGADKLKERDFAIPACHLAIGIIATDKGKMKEALKSLLTAETLLRGHEDKACRELYGCLLRYKADWHDRNHEKEEAERLLRQSVSVLTDLGVDSSVQLANSLSDLCFLLVRTNKLTEAEPLILSALDLYAKTLGRESPAYDWAKMIYQICLNKEDEEALYQMFEMSATTLQYKVGAQNPNLVRALKIYAHALKNKNMTESLDRAREKFQALIQS